MSLKGTWRNELGSLLKLKVDNTSPLPGGGALVKLSGQFVEGTHHDTSKREVFPISGSAIENRQGDLLVTFQVIFTPSRAFPNRSAIANWSGRLISKDGRDKLHTVWTLACLYETAAKNGRAVRKLTQQWNHTLTNADVFARHR